MWQSSVGASLQPTWPTGIGGVGNEGIASYLQRTRFAIGYVEYAYARAHHLSDVALRNRAGNFVRAGRATFHAAAEQADWNDLKQFQQLAIDPAGPASWPITAASFILISTAVDRRSHALEALKFFDWALQHGATIVGNLDYEPIQTTAVEQLRALWREQFHIESGQLIWR